MKLWADREDTIEVRWFRAPEGARFVPYENVYWSLNWDDTWRTRAVGEVYGAARPYDKGANPQRYKGNCFCGSSSAWAGEARFEVDPVYQTDENGYSQCCGARTVVPDPVWVSCDAPQMDPGSGGVAVGGLAEWSFSVTVQGTGGVAIGGSAQWAHSAPIEGTGGVAIGGEADWFDAAIEGTGGLEIGGEADWSEVAQIGQGGMELGGVADWFAEWVVGQGGVEMGGVADWDFTPVVTAPDVASFTQQTGTASGSYSIGKPSGTAAGDLLLFHSQVITTTDPPALPSGFTRYTSRNLPFNLKGIVGYKVAGGSEPSSYTVTDSSMTDYATHLLRITNADTSEFDADISTGNPKPPVSPARSTPVDHCLLITYGFCLSASAAAPPSPWVTVANDSLDFIASMTSKQHDVSAGSHGPWTWTCPAGSNWMAYTVEIPPA